MNEIFFYCILLYYACAYVFSFNAFSVYVHGTRFPVMMAARTALHPLHGERGGDMTVYYKSPKVAALGLNGLSVELKKVRLPPAEH